MAKTNPKKKTSNLTKYNRAGYFFVAPFVIGYIVKKWRKHPDPKK